MAAEGIVIRHRAACRLRNDGKRCSCTPSFRAQVADPATGERVKRTFAGEDAATQWRRDMLTAFANGTPTRDETVSTMTVSAALDELVARIKDGRTLNRSGRPYRPATIRSYEHTADVYLRPMMGHMRVADVRRRDVQDFVDELRRTGLSASSVHNKLDTLRVLFKLAIEREWRDDSPCVNLRLPAVRSKRPEIADPEQARTLLAALPVAQVALWAVLFFAGLRIGEARALRWRNVDFERNVIRIEHGWDEVEGEQDAKTDAGERIVPLIGELRAHLAAHKLATGRGDDDLCFGRTASEPFVRSTVRAHALTAWGWRVKETRRDGKRRKVLVKAREDALDPVTPHGARHTCASYLIAAGVDDMTLQAVIGHSDVRTTKNVYGHLLPNALDNVRERLDAFLSRSPQGPRLHDSERF
jgi:integrase